jgi:hypothetical protein
MNAPMAKFTIDEDEVLIECVATNFPIYYPHNKDYKNLSIRFVIWKDINETNGRND